MKILHLSTSDIEGGAARAGYRLHQGLKQIGATSQMLVRAKLSTDKTVVTEKTLLTKLGPSLNNLPLKFYSKSETSLFSAQCSPDAIASNVTKLNPDIINLHWICNGYLKIETIAKLNKPVVWTLHDMWAFTGGCHYTGDCDRFTNSCGACPQLNSEKDRDLSRQVWQRKHQAWKNLNLTLTTPSHWMAQAARKSSLFKDRRIEVIPYGLDTQVYKPIDKQVARELLNLPQHKQLIVFGALSATTDERKGFSLLQAALKKLSQSHAQNSIEVVVFGASQPEKPVDLGFKAHYLGHLHDDLSLALVYSAADVMVVPSIQEAFGQTASESLACRTPVVVFNQTGLTDIVEHQQNGYVARAFDIDDLAHGIGWVLENEERHQKLCDRARQKAEQEYNLALQAHRYLSLYNEILESCYKQSSAYAINTTYKSFSPYSSRP